MPSSPAPLWRWSPNRRSSLRIRLRRRRGPTSNAYEFAWRAPSTLDRRRVECRAVGVARQERRQRDRRIGPVDELRKTLLPETVVEPPLERAQLALRHPVRRARGVRLLRAFLRRQVRKILQTDALAVLAVARCAREIVRAAAEIEHLLAERVHLLHVRIVESP